MTVDSHASAPGEPGRHRRGAAPPPPALLHRRDGILPTTAAALSLPESGALTGTATRAAEAPALHPVVEDVYGGLGPGQRERHLGRCPEAALLSRHLHQVGAADLAEARDALRDAGITTRHIREDGDPEHGSYAPHCRSCAVLIARLGVRSYSATPLVDDAVGGAGGPAAGAPWGVGDAEAALTAAGWQPGRLHAAQAERWADVLSGHRSPHGHPHQLFPAAFEAWAELGSVTLRPTGPGVELAAGTVVIDPLLGRHWARTLGELGRALDTELCPLGAEGGGTALLAVDRQGRLYCVDHTGDWYLGHDVLTGLSTLLTGIRPHRLVPPDPD